MTEQSGEEGELSKLIHQALNWSSLTFLMVIGQKDSWTKDSLVEPRLRTFKF